MTNNIVVFRTCTGNTYYVDTEAKAYWTSRAPDEVETYDWMSPVEVGHRVIFSNNGSEHGEGRSLLTSMIEEVRSS